MHDIFCADGDADVTNKHDLLQKEKIMVIMQYGVLNALCRVIIICNY